MPSSAAVTMPRFPTATLEPVRFGEFLRDRHLISDEQWIAALADHWSSSKRRRIGQTIIDNGFLSPDVIESEARAFHDELDIVEVAAPGDEEEHARTERSEKPTLPAMAVSAVPAF